MTHPQAGRMTFIVVPPNSPAYSDPAVLRRLESYLSRSFPTDNIDVAWVVQPRIPTFTVVCHGLDAETDVAETRKSLILSALDEFDPNDLRDKSH